MWIFEDALYLSEHCGFSNFWAFRRTSTELRYHMNLQLIALLSWYAEHSLPHAFQASATKCSYFRFGSKCQQISLASNFRPSVGKTNLDQLYSSINHHTTTAKDHILRILALSSPFRCPSVCDKCDTLPFLHYIDHANQIFSESLWQPLTPQPLTHQPSWPTRPTQKPPNLSCLSTI